MPMPVLWLFNSRAQAARSSGPQEVIRNCPGHRMTTPSRRTATNASQKRHGAQVTCEPVRTIRVSVRDMTRKNVQKRVYGNDKDLHFRQAGRHSGRQNGTPHFMATCRETSGAVPWKVEPSPSQSGNHPIGPTIAAELDFGVLRVPELPRIPAFHNTS